MLSLVGVVLAVALVSIVGLQVWRGWGVRAIPGPRRFPVIGNIPDLLRRPWSRLLKFSRVYGPIFKVFVWDCPVLFVSDPDALKRVLVTNRPNYAKDPWSYTVFERLLGKGIVTSEGEHWKRKRALMSPAFHVKALDRIMPVFTAATDRLRQQWEAFPANHVIEVDSAFRQLTLEVISEVTIGLSASDSHVLPKLFVSVMDEMNYRVFAPYRKLYPSNRAHVKALNDLDQLLLGVINARREAVATGTAPAHADILGVLLAAEQPLGDTEICDELKTMLLAGHETSSMMLTWALYLLCRHPEAMAKATAFVDAMFEASPQPSMEQYRELSYLLYCLKEGMRLFSPVPALTRETVAEDTLGGFRIPACTKIAIDIWSVHHSEAIWGKDVEDFRPERFSEAESRGRNPFAFLPFSVGKRNCVGQHLALLEGQVVLANMLRAFTVALVPKHPSVATQGFIVPVRPENGVFVTVTPRNV